MFVFVCILSVSFMFFACILSVSSCILPVFFCFVLYFSVRSSHRSVNASCAFASMQLHERIVVASRSHRGRIAVVASRLLSRIAVVQRRSQSAGGLTTSLQSVHTASAAGSGQSDNDDICRRRGQIVVVRCTGEQLCTIRRGV